LSRPQPGQALIEFALSLSLLCLLILGIVDAGRAVVAAISLANAAREGARYAALHWRDATWSSQASTVITNTALGLDTNRLTIVSLSVDQQAQLATVQLGYAFTAAAPLVGNALGPINLTASSSMLTH
jgi:Flp pilus assembly protein TadG